MNNNDLIIRAALLEDIRSLAKDIARNNGGVDDITLALKEAFDMTKAAPAVDAAPKWISVDDRLPDMCGMPCLLYGINQYGQGRVFEGFTGYMQTGQLTWHATSAENDIAALNVSHWMPLPEPPKMDTEN